jgi:hypothetical protein
LIDIEIPVDLVHNPKNFGLIDDYCFNYLEDFMKKEENKEFLSSDGLFFLMHLDGTDEIGHKFTP